MSIKLHTQILLYYIGVTVAYVEVNQNTKIFKRGKSGSVINAVHSGTD